MKRIFLSNFHQRIMIVLSQDSEETSKRFTQNYFREAVLVSALYLDNQYIPLTGYEYCSVDTIGNVFAGN